jgi:hypothetical protein
VRKSTLILLVLFALAGWSQAQEISAAFGVSGMWAPSANSTNLVTSNGNTFFPQSIGTGTWPVVSGSFVTAKRIGVEGEFTWRAKQNFYDGFQPFRPIFWDINALYAPKLGNRATLELLGGIGSEDVRFYGVTNCSTFTGCTNFVSEKHLLGDLGAGLRLYATKNFFIRPEARFYFVRNNFDFSGARAMRGGVSLGFTF